MQFTKAERKRSFLRLGLTGPSGSGKTYGALLIAKGIGGKIAVVDTEHGSASLYSHLSEFDVLNLSPPYRPERFIECIEAAEKAGYTTLIIDSLTHEWNGKGGILELVDEVAKAHTRGNTWAAWSLLTPRHRAMIDTILRAKMHVICTLRSKTESTQVDDGGRKKVVKLGLKSEQRDGFEYELTTVLDNIHDGHFAVASKDRSGLFAGGDPEKITPETGSRLLAWLNSGGEMLPQLESPAVEADGDEQVDPDTVIVGVDDLASQAPGVAEQAHGWDPSTSSTTSKQKRQWKCHLGHKWEASVKEMLGIAGGCSKCQELAAAPVTPEQLKKIGDGIKFFATAAGANHRAIGDMLKARFSVASSRDLTSAQADEALQWLAEKCKEESREDL